ncbi:MAG: hypothetical protein OEV44_04665, partial [Spirochaetota bacterium]|nr:hypothetical protein [Spirochaetota bacterium]
MLRTFKFGFLFFIMLLPCYFLQGDNTFSDRYVGEFYEWTAPTRQSKPDQIKIDPFNDNLVWFTQPAINGVAKFNFTTKIITEYGTNGPYRPDGLTIDDEGILWFGEQCGSSDETNDCQASSLGTFDPETEEFKHYKLPYKDANPAIPSIDNTGFIWISDHSNNKIIRFDPKKESFWIIEPPTPKSWVVDLKADSKNKVW